MLIPVGMTDETQWRQHCQSIYTTALDLLDSRLGVIESAREILRLSHLTQAAQAPEFTVFIAIDSETHDLPVVETRHYWLPEALELEDVRIRQIEQRWDERARAAAACLVQRYQWAIPQSNSAEVVKENPPFQA